jgi:hypothetical protein
MRGFGGFVLQPLPALATVEQGLASTTMTTPAGRKKEEGGGEVMKEEGREGGLY